MEDCFLSLRYHTQHKTLYEHGTDVLKIVCFLLRLFSSTDKELCIPSTQKKVSIRRTFPLARDDVEERFCKRPSEEWVCITHCQIEIRRCCPSIISVLLSPDERFHHRERQTSSRAVIAYGQVLTHLFLRICVQPRATVASRFRQVPAFQCVIKSHLIKSGR